MQGREFSVCGTVQHSDLVWQVIFIGLVTTAFCLWAEASSEGAGETQSVGGAPNSSCFPSALLTRWQARALRNVDAAPAALVRRPFQLVLKDSEGTT